MAWNSGSPRLSLVTAALVGLLLLEVILGTMNLVGLRVERRISGEIFAGDPVAGIYVIENQRRAGTCGSLRVREHGAGEVEGASLNASGRIASGQRCELAASWTFLQRGDRPLCVVMVESR